MRMLTGMGSLNKIAEMLPGNLTGRMKNVDMNNTENKLQKFRNHIYPHMKENRKKIFKN